MMMMMMMMIIDDDDDDDGGGDDDVFSHKIRSYRTPESLKLQGGRFGFLVQRISKST